MVGGQHVHQQIEITVEELVCDAERRGRVVGVRIATADEEDHEPWTAPPSRRRKGTSTSTCYSPFLIVQI